MSLFSTISSGKKNANDSASVTIKFEKTEFETSSFQLNLLLISTVNGFTEGGGWGEITSEACLKMGIRALVTDGAVRDTVEIAKLGFPVFARAISIKGTTKLQAGLINHPIIIGGVRVEPGDIVVGDPDGVVVVPLHEAEAVLIKAQEKIDFEKKVIEEIREGKLTIDILGLRPILKELGLED